MSQYQKMQPLSLQMKKAGAEKYVIGRRLAVLKEKSWRDL